MRRVWERATGAPETPQRSASTAISTGPPGKAAKKAVVPSVRARRTSMSAVTKPAAMVRAAAPSMSPAWAASAVTASCVK